MYLDYFVSYLPGRSGRASNEQLKLTARFLSESLG
jgi:hypothetical protein